MQQELVTAYHLLRQSAARLTFNRSIAHTPPLEVSMAIRTFVAGVLGGIAMFIWTSFAHLALPLGEAGIREVPNEKSVLSTLQQNAGDQPALYLFPGLGVGPNPTREQRNEAMKHIADKYASGASGFLMYHPPGRVLTFGKWMAIEFVTELIESILAVWLLSQTRLAGFGPRVGFVLVVGIVAAMATNVSYWNWYGFPTVYTASYMLIEVVGFLCVGLVAAFLLRKTTMGTQQT